jgi:hypothetical protein
VYSSIHNTINWSSRKKMHPPRVAIVQKFLRHLQLKERDLYRHTEQENQFHGEEGSEVKWRRKQKLLHLTKQVSQEVKDCCGDGLCPNRIPLCH